MTPEAVTQQDELLDVQVSTPLLDERDDCIPALDGIFWERHSRAQSKSWYVDTVDFPVLAHVLVILVKAWNTSAQSVYHHQGASLPEPTLMSGREVNGVNGCILPHVHIFNFVVTFKV